MGAPRRSGWPAPSPRPSGTRRRDHCRRLPWCSPLRRWRRARTQTAHAPGPPASASASCCPGRTAPFGPAR
eukprot:12885402-Alexandrium_andersonii.AAC.1